MLKMKKYAYALIAVFAAALFSAVSPAEAKGTFSDVQSNYAKIGTLSCLTESVVSNSKGKELTKGKLLVSGNDKRFDVVSSDKMTFILFGDNYTVYSHQDKKLTKKKIKDLSDAHIILLEEMLWTVLYNPLLILHERFVMPPFATIKDEQNSIVAVSKRDQAASVRVFFDSGVITRMEYYYRDHLNKKVTFSNPVESGSAKIPTRVTISAMSGAKEILHIDLNVANIEMNRSIPETAFSRID